MKFSPRLLAGWSLGFFAVAYLYVLKSVVIGGDVLPGHAMALDVRRDSCCSP
jgi:hypothetical protein